MHGHMGLYAMRRRQWHLTSQKIYSNKNMPEPLLWSYCCSKQVLFEMCSRNGRTTVTTPRKVTDVDQSTSSLTQFPFIWSSQPLFRSPSHPPSPCNPPAPCSIGMQSCPWYDGGHTTEAKHSKQMQCTRNSKHTPSEYCKLQGVWIYREGGREEGINT